MDIFTVLLPTAPKIRFENNAIFFKKILKHKIPHTDSMSETLALIILENLSLTFLTINAAPMISVHRLR